MDNPEDDFRLEFKTVRYDRFSGAEVQVPSWLPDATIGVMHEKGGRVRVYLDVSWDGGGWICAGVGETELLAANDLVRRLRNIGK